MGPITRLAVPDEPRSAITAAAHERPDGTLVRRPRFFEAPQRGTAGPVTCTGRASSGKTVLVRSWLLDGAFALASRAVKT